MKKYNFYKIFTLYFIIFGIVLSLFGATVNYIYQTRTLKQDIKGKAEDIFDLKVNSILKPAFKNIENTVISLSENKTIKEYIDRPAKNREKELEQIFLNVAASNSNIMKIRFISKKGYGDNQDRKNKKRGESIYHG